MLMAATRAYLRAFAQTQPDVGRILALANKVLAEDLSDGRNVTLLLAELDPHARTLRHTSAGHPAGYVLDPAGRVRAELLSTDLPLGILPDGDYPTTEAVELFPGELVLLLTDGVLDAPSAGGERFGAERALEVARAHQRQGARAVVEGLCAAARAFGGGRPQPDDVTALAVKVSA
jgi:serine phosphatase RsbU (regulator of sigma subunit)